MSETFDAFDFLSFARRRWRVVAIACGIAVFLSAGLSLLLPKRYTATASIVIEPPGGSDVRAATAVSPGYLESLRSYERFAASDTLFARAVERFHLQTGAHPVAIDALKGRVLKVSKIRDTKILEINATLEDPRLAQEFVEYLANETVTLSRNDSLAADREHLDDAGKQLAEAEARLAKTRAAWVDSAGADSTEALQSSLDANGDVVARIRRGLVSDGNTPAVEHRLTEVEKSMARDGAELARRSAHRQALEMQLNAAQAAFDSAFEHLNQVRANAGSRGERLRVIDPGIIPQRPSSPNVMLNVIAALLFALLASLVYLSLAFAAQSGARRNTPELKARRVFSR